MVARGRPSHFHFTIFVGWFFRLAHEVTGEPISLQRVFSFLHKMLFWRDSEWCVVRTMGSNTVAGTDRVSLLLGSWKIGKPRNSHDSGLTIVHS